MSSTTTDYAAATGLPKKTQSICPDCGKLLEATVYEKDGKVMIDKTCPEHGKFTDVYWSDAKLYLKAEKFAKDGIGLKNPMDKSLKPGENVHIMVDGERVDMLSCTALANLDLTNRCNMHCPICFANANDAGYVYEPEYDQVCKMLDCLRSEEPIKCTAVQFAGGEPTVYPRFVDVIRAAKERHFAQVMVASNGLKFAHDYQFLKDSAAAGLNTIYLQFDGLTDDIYLRSRGRKMVAVKQAVIDNCIKLRDETGHSPSIVLVVTGVRGMNDKILGDIIRYAMKYSRVVRGVNLQPVSFTGRMTREEIDKGRITLTDVAKDISEQTGFTTMDDWYPVPVVAEVSDYASVILGQNKVTLTAHPHCGLATYLFIQDDGKVVPFPQFIDIDKFVTGLGDIAKKAEDAAFKKLTVLKVKKLLENCLIEKNMPSGMSKEEFIHMIVSVMSNKSKETLAKFSWKMMYVGAMHFQDSFNYDVERVRRCAIHYVTPDCKVIPFCAYNSGPEMRVATEKEFSVPVEEWKKTHQTEAKSIAEALIVPEDQRGEVPEDKKE
ncbi:MAG: radical SAM protein [Methanomethylophilus sp.]